MARKQKDRASDVAPAMEGWTPLSIYGGGHIHELEDVQLEVTPERAAAIAVEMKSLASVIAEKLRAVAEAKAALRPHQERHGDLVRALSSGELPEERDVWKYISKDGRTVRLVDPKTGEVLQERSPHWDEEQTDLGDEDSDNE